MIEKRLVPENKIPASSSLPCFGLLYVLGPPWNKHSKEFVFHIVSMWMTASPPVTCYEEGPITPLKGACTLSQLTSGGSSSNNQITQWTKSLVTTPSPWSATPSCLFVLLLLLFLLLLCCMHKRCALTPYHEDALMSQVPSKKVGRGCPVVYSYNLR